MNMKRILYILSAILLLAACTEKMAPEGAVTTICASLEQVGTKSALDGQDVVWSGGDKIKVYNASTPEGKIYTLTSGAGTTLGTFSSDDPVTGAGPYEAVYPADAVTGEWPSFVVSIPEQQNYAAGSFASGTNISLAKGNDPASLLFHNACGILRLTIRGDKTIDHIVVSPLLYEPITGGFQLSMTQNPLILLPPDGLNHPPVTLACGPGGVALTEDGVDFHFVLPANTLDSGFQAVIYDTDGGSMTLKGVSGLCRINRAQIRPMFPVTYAPD